MFVLKSWLPLALITTILSGLVYTSVQQNFRQGANDPQIQLAEDAAEALNQGQLPTQVIPSASIDVTRSLAPFVIVYNQAKQPIAASGLLDNQIPTPPLGVFDSAATQGQNRLTWQPKPSLRYAIVITPYTQHGGGFVLAGRSLREVEIREARLTQMVGLAWLVSLVLSFGLLGFLHQFPTQK